jgi:RHS repeat-associated protein
VTGTLSAWPGERGFVGGTTDAVTGLTHLGAREYDPVLGRFISADPLLDPADPQQIDGYTYGNGNPTTNPDSDGLHCNNGFDGDYCYTPSSGNIPVAGSGGPIAAPPGIGNPQPGPVAAPAPTPMPSAASSPTRTRPTPRPSAQAPPPPRDCYEGRPSIVIELIRAISGYDDIVGCAQGSSGGCVWAAAGATPVGKAGKVAKAVKATEDASDAAKAERAVSASRAD